jgi:hypothetical protein
VDPSSTPTRTSGTRLRTTISGCGFTSIFDGFREIPEDRPIAAQSRLFCVKARDLYRLQPSNAENKEPS